MKAPGTAQLLPADQTPSPPLSSPRRPCWGSLQASKVYPAPDRDAQRHGQAWGNAEQWGH